MVFQTPLNVSNLVILLGIALFFGYYSSLLLERVGVPNVLVYIIIGFLGGNLLDTYIGFLDTSSYEYWYRFIENIALGLIGFKIGTEMKIDLLKRNFKSIASITIVQVVLTFVIVFIASFLYFQDVVLSLIFGGLATATAPAATMEIIRKFKASGYLTTRVQWVLAFDDVLAVLIVEVIIAYASIAIVGNTVTILGLLYGIWKEIGVALVLGGVVGILLDLIIENMEEEQDLEMMEISLGALILVIGLAMQLHTSVILATMTVGGIVVNREGDNYHKVSNLLEIIMSPILIMFFVMIGTSLKFSAFTPLPWFAMLYFVTRAIGKVYGTSLGAQWGNAKDVVKQNLGLTMLPQGGVALGLMVVASDLYSEAGIEETGLIILTTIVISTVFSEGIGSLFSLFGLSRAGEIPKGKNKENPVVQKAIEGSEFV